MLQSVDNKRLDKAITAHRETATIFREIAGRDREGIALNNLGRNQAAVQAE